VKKNRKNSNSRVEVKKKEIMELKIVKKMLGKNSNKEKMRGKA
jgi:hypothetical protein